jgi:uncharacterized protein YdaL
MFRRRTVSRRAAVLAAALLILLLSIAPSYAETADISKYTKKNHLVIDSIYPYNDPDVLLKCVKNLVGKREAFILSVMPVTSNGDYPAMKHFCGILRYAQANGASIALHVPLGTPKKSGEDDIIKIMQKSLKIYADNGVYPVAVTAGADWMEKVPDLMKSFGTVLISYDRGEESDDIARDVKKGTIPSAYLISGKYTLVPYAVTFSEDESDLMKAVERVRNMSLGTYDFRDSDRSVSAGRQNIDLKDGVFYVNGKARDISYTNDEVSPDDYDYRHSAVDQLSADLTTMSRRLRFAVMIFAALFIIMLFIARRMNRPRFVRRNGRRNRRGDTDSRKGT